MKWFSFNKQNAVAPTNVAERLPVMLPSQDDDFTMGARAERLMQPATWDDIRAFCAAQAEQEIVNAKGDTMSAAESAHKAQALLNLPNAIMSAAQISQALRAQQAAAQQQPKDDDNNPAHVSRKFAARFA